MTELPDTCLACRAPSTKLCDFVLGHQLGATLPHPVITSIDAEMFTCDAPLCDACATFAGNVFFCGRDPSIESVDYCPEHINTSAEGRPIMPADAEYLRRQTWAKLRRRAIRTPAHGQRDEG